MRSISALVAALLSCGAFAVPPERVAIRSLDAKLELPGFWFGAKAASPRPAVISLHGCGGPYDSKGRLNLGFYRDGTYFNAEGMHVLALDSFTPRGQPSLCDLKPSERRITEDDRREDVFAAIRWLAARSDVDATRIVVLGRSHGGQTVLSVVDRSSSLVKAQPVQPRAAVALYPGCSYTLRQSFFRLGVPLLLMIGELDDWTPAQRCIDLHKQLRSRQKDAAFDLVVYPGAYHGFDGTAPVAVRKGLGTVKGGEAHVGGNAEARWQAHQRTFDFVAAQLGVPLARTHEARFKMKVSRN
jgi:dienelactone hydrolase